MINNRRSREKGIGLVEVVIAASILSAISLSFLGTVALLSRFHEKNMFYIKGELLAEEGLEALRLMKSGGWSNLADIPKGVPVYLELGSSSWSATTTPEVVDGIFQRSFRIYDVRRNAADDIVTSGGSIDEGTLLTEVTVSWLWRKATSTVTYSTYVTNI